MLPTLMRTINPGRDSGPDSGQFSRSFSTEAAGEPQRPARLRYEERTACRPDALGTLSIYVLALTGRVQARSDRIIDIFQPLDMDGLARQFRNIIEVFLVRAGNSTRVMPASAAASTFSLTPPIGTTWARGKISPVIAVSLRTVRRPFPAR